MFSRDGTKLAFLRRDRAPVDAEPELISIHVANADGTNELDLTGPLDAPDQWDWSPAGDAIAVTSKIGGRYTLQVVPTDGSEPPRVVETGMAVTFPSCLPPNGEEIVFRGVAPTPDGLRSGLFAISPDGGEPRPLTATDGHHDGGYQVPVPSPDGTHLLYQVWDPVAEIEYAVPARPRDRHGRGTPAHRGTVWRGSRRVLAGRLARRVPRLRGTGYRLYVGACRRQRGATGPHRDHPGDAWHEFSPDGTKVMLNRFGNGTLLIDVESGAAETLPDTIEDPANLAAARAVS